MRRPVRTRVQEQFGITPAPADPGFLLTSKAAAQATPGADPLPYPQTSRNLQVWHPWLYPFPGSIDFRQNGSFQSVGVGDTVPAALSLTLPKNKRGIIANVGYSILNLTTSSNILWQVLINSAPVLGWQNLTFFPGNVPRLAASEDAKIPVPMGGKIDILFRNLDGTTYTVGANYYGWFWDDEAERNWMGEAR